MNKIVYKAVKIKFDEAISELQKIVEKKELCLCHIVGKENIEKIRKNELQRSLQTNAKY